MYLQPNGITAEEALHGMLRILDPHVVVKAEFLLLHSLLRERPADEGS